MANLISRLLGKTVANSRNISMNDTLYQYILDNTLRDQEILQRLREETSLDRDGDMQVGPDQGQLLALLAKLTNAKRTIEVGVFTGYSTLCTAMALPDDGEIIACDISRRWTSIATRYWREAGVDSKIKLHLAPGQETLQALIDDNQVGSFDFAFIDADKTGYDAYYELCLTLLRPGGLIAIDNVLWGGAVANPKRQDADTVALRALNAKLKDDDRVDLSMLPIGDGLTLALKRP
ncbi:MAG: class I SAM-dependent methyltransferase [Pseudomonadota bacterium]